MTKIAFVSLNCLLWDKAENRRGNLGFTLYVLFAINSSNPLKGSRDRARNTYFLSPKMPEGTQKVFLLKDKVKGHGAKLKGIYKFISMNNYNHYVSLTLFQTIKTYLHFLMLLCNWDLQYVKVMISHVSVHMFQ